MSNWEQFHTEEREGFTVTFYAEPEDMDPADSFEDEEDIEAVRSGKWEWFRVKCEASKAGVVLGVDHLGACAYVNVSDFITPGDGYSEDMANTAVDEAKAKLAELNRNA